ncbi:SDR family oxidoreductase [candidate division KSB1 bacterium]|nr:SDR family oxidoreductase [candidate division KSB1 bacterium]
MKKTAIITGATGALGSVMVKYFLRHNYKVAGIARDETTLKSLGAGNLPDYLPVAADVTVEKEVEAAFIKTVNKFGPIDVLVHCAGGFRAGRLVRDMDMVEWDLMMDLNLKSAFLCGKYAMQSMMKQKSGKIITISALAVKNPGPKKAAYLASKAGLVTLTKALAAEGKNDNIQVNAVAPSIIRTPANEQAMPQADFTEWVEPEKIAETVLFLCSDHANRISGTIIEMPGKV